MEVLETEVSIKRIKVSLPVKIYEVLVDLCYVDVKGTPAKVKIDSVSALALECLVRGLEEVLKERRLLLEVELAVKSGKQRRLDRYIFSNRKSDGSFGRKSHAAERARLKELERNKGG